MQVDLFARLTWWMWAALAIVCAAGFVWARHAASRSRHRREEERLARKADATHEGAKTRHEGGP